MGFNRILPMMALSLSTLSFLACGPSKKTDAKPKTLSQLTEESSEDGYHLCVLNYHYAYSETEATDGYIAVAGMHREDLKKDILNKCVALPTEQSQACSNPSVFNNLHCVHVDALDEWTKQKKDEKEEAGKTFECSYRSKWRYAGKSYGQYETFKMSANDKKSLAIQGLIQECVGLSELERAGCVQALVSGQLRCIQKPSP